jgi:hypothetical protein
MEDTGTATIDRLMGILAGTTPLSHGVEIIAQDVVIYMDGHTFRGINTWAAWLHYMRIRSRVADFDVQVDELVTNADGTISAYGRWKGQVKGSPVYSPPVWAHYRVVEGKVVEIWTTRTNYVFMLGPLMRTQAGHLLIMLHLFFWAKTAGGPDLRTAAAVTTTPQPLAACEESAVS